MKPVWFAEIEPFPSAVLAHHWPTVKNLSDMTLVAEMIAAGTITAPDILVGGTPCQAFSVAGSRKGLSDERGQLTLAYVDILNAIDKQRPGNEAVCVWENVPGVLSSKDNAFGCFLGKLVGEDRELRPAGRKWTNAGCVSGPQRTIAWRILDAQYFGVAQRRRRVFVVASAREGFDPIKVLFESEGVRRDIAPSRETGKAVAALTASGVGTCGADDNQAQAGHIVEGKQWPADIAATLNASFGDKQGLEDQHALGGASWFVPAVGWDAYQHHNWRESDQVNTLTANLQRGVCGDSPLVTCFQSKASASNSMNPSVIAPTLDVGKSDGLAICYPINDKATRHAGKTGKGSGKDGDPSPTLTMGDKHAVACFKAGQGAKAGGIGYAEEIAPTLTATDSGSQQSPALLQEMAVRRLTPVECARLQGFPDNHTKIPWRNKPLEDCPDGPRYKAYGNSKAVPVVRWLGRRILNELT